MAAAAIVGRREEQYICCEVRTLAERRVLSETLKGWKKDHDNYLGQSELKKRRALFSENAIRYVADHYLYDNARSVSKAIEGEIVNPVKFTRFVSVHAVATKKTQAVVQFYLLDRYIYLCSLLSAPDNLRWSENVVRHGPRLSGAGSAAMNYVIKLARDLGRKEIRIYPLVGSDAFYERFGMRWNPEKKVLVYKLEPQKRYGASCVA